MDWAMDYADYIDRTDYDSVDAVRAGIDTGAADAALEAFYDNDIDGITENIIGRRAARLRPAFHKESGPRRWERSRRRSGQSGI